MSLAHGAATAAAAIHDLADAVERFAAATHAMLTSVEANSAAPLNDVALATALRRGQLPQTLLELTKRVG